MGADEDKQRASSAREQRQLRATLGEEPSSSYAYHDEARVEHVRPLGSGKPANDTSPAGGLRVSAGPRASKATMVGLGAQHAPLAPEKMAHRVSPTMSSTPSTARRSKLSEPPDIGSWPPLPQVPDELDDVADTAPPKVARDRSDHDEDDEPEEALTEPPRRAVADAGAIWSATPPVVGITPSDHGLSDDLEEPPAEIELEAAGVSKSSHEAALVTATLGTPMDPELVKLEQLVARGAWEELAKLGSDPTRPALHRLMHVIALRETLPSDAKGAGRLTQDAIAALSEMLGVSDSSPTVLMLAKRLLRRNPVWTHTQPATGVSAGIVVLGLLIGCAVGWLLTRYVM